MRTPVLGLLVIAAGAAAACAARSNEDVDQSDDALHCHLKQCPPQTDAQPPTTTGDAGDGTDADEGIDGDPGCGSDCAPASLPACGGTAEIDGPIAAPSFPWYGTYTPAPLLLAGDNAHLFIETSGMWVSASRGSALTRAVPSQLTGGTMFTGARSLSGGQVLVFQRSGQVLASVFDGTNFGAPIVTPCDGGGLGNGACQARVAGDGHLWIYSGSNLYEQTAGGFENRGGPPTPAQLWDVDAQGTVIVVGSGTTFTDEILAVWKLPRGAGGWSKAGALMKADVASAAATIENGFSFGDMGIGALAPDGSIHLFSDPRCIGTGDRNKKQVHVRSRDGARWQVEALPDVATLTDSQVTWHDPAFWAADYDTVRYVTVSSVKPAYDGFTWTYPDRQYNLIARCRAADGRATFARTAKLRLPGWTDRGFSGFSGSGAATFVTREGLTQVY